MPFEKNIQVFIDEHRHLNSKDVALKLSKRSDLPKDLIINQINGRQKAKKKLPEFFANETILYPSPLSMEQCSSETTAQYKNSLVNGESLIDLTAGFGIDSFYFAKRFKSVISVELNKELCELTQQNLEALSIKNIQIENNTAEEFIESFKEKVDVIFIDPSRRVDAKKVHGFADCEPNVLKLLPQLFERSNIIMIKASPLVDIKKSLEELCHVKEVHVVSVGNDCKELLFILEKDFIGECQINTINFGKTEKKFSFTFSEEAEINANYSDALAYLYEPNSAILKAGAFKAIAKQFDLKKIAQHTHLYTSEALVNDFPGRAFKIEHNLAYSKKEISKLGLSKANISTRNFSDSVEMVKKKLKLKDGGDTYVFACKNKEDRQVVLVCFKNPE